MNKYENHDANDKTHDDKKHEDKQHDSYSQEKDELTKGHDDQCQAIHAEYDKYKNAWRDYDRNWLTMRLDEMKRDFESCITEEMVQTMHKNISMDHHDTEYADNNDKKEHKEYREVAKDDKHDVPQYVFAKHYSQNKAEMKHTSSDRYEHCRNDQMKHSTNDMTWKPYHKASNNYDEARYMPHKDWQYSSYKNSMMNRT